VYDPNAGGAQMAQLLDKGEHPRQGDARFDFVEHSQDNAPMAQAAQRLDEAIRSGWLLHDQNPDLRKHVLNAVRKSLGGEKWKYDRPPEAKGEARRKFPIDALTGLLMAHNVAMDEMGGQGSGDAFFL
jgi:phage terminase large subunit-like protein